MESSEYIKLILVYDKSHLSAKEMEWKRRGEKYWFQQLEKRRKTETLDFCVQMKGGILNKTIWVLKVPPDSNSTGDASDFTGKGKPNSR